MALTTGEQGGATTVAGGGAQGDPVRRYDNGMGAYTYVFADGSELTDWGGTEYGDVPKASSTGGGSSSPNTQMVQDPVTGQWILVDTVTGQPVGTPVGTARPPAAPQTQTEVINGTLYERTQNPDGTWGPWKPSEGLPSAKKPTTIKDTGKGGTIAITENPDGTFTTTTIIPDQPDPPKTQVIDGILYQYDEVSKEWKTTGVGTSSSAAQLQAAQMQISANAAENAANRAFQSAEAKAAREFTAKENALGRQLDAKQFAAQFGLDSARFLAEVDRNRAEAAAKFAEIVSSTDPSALPAYRAAVGGGSLTNALGTGKDMITDAALLPSARMLGLARKEAPALPTFDASEWAVGGAVKGPGLGRTSVTRATRGRGMGEAAEVANVTPANLGGDTGGSLGLLGDAAKRRFGAVQGPVFAARGFQGTVTRPTVFVAGEGGRPENVNITPQGGGDQLTSALQRFRTGFGGASSAPATRPAAPAATFGRPSTTTQTRFGGTASAPRLPAAATALSRPSPGSSSLPPPPPQGAPQSPPAGVTRPPIGASVPPPPAPPVAPSSADIAAGLGAQGYGLGGYVPTPEERALMDEVRGIRTGVQLPWEDERYFNNVAFANEDPILQQLLMKGLAAKKGVPLESLWAESRRNALSGLGRQAVGIGY